MTVKAEASDQGKFIQCLPLRRGRRRLDGMTTVDTHIILPNARRDAGRQLRHLTSLSMRIASVNH
jgi:hypothetical protein